MSDEPSGTPTGEPAEQSPPVPAAMQTEMWPIERIKRYWRNPRRKQNIEKMAALLRRYHWRQPIVVDADGEIIVGDTRYLGAIANKDKFVPVWVARDMPEAEAHAYRIADNRIAEETEWDEQSLTAELELLQSLGMSDLEEATAFDEDELAKYLDSATDDGETHLEQVDVKPFPPYTWALIGIPTQRYIEIAEQIEAISAIDDIFCEITASDEKP